PSDHKGANAPSDSVPAGLVPAVPNLIPTAVAAGGDTSSAPDATSPVGSSPIPALQSEAILSGPSTSPRGGREGASNSASTQQPGGAVDPRPSVSATAENALAAMLSVTSALPQVDALQTASPPGLKAAAESGAAATAAASAVVPSAPSTPM